MEARCGGLAMSKCACCRVSFEWTGDKAKHPRCAFCRLYCQVIPGETNKVPPKFTHTPVKVFQK